jgi:tRNA threonylcarbamoyladenosine biosynthesis protein TsaE
MKGIPFKIHNHGKRFLATLGMTKETAFTSNDLMPLSNQTIKQSNSRGWSVPSPEAWAGIACEIAPTLSAGGILALQGPLGAGKTTFVQALAAELGSARNPKSPTFTMLRTYAINRNGLSRLLHLDAYRIEDEKDLLPLDLDEELSEPGTILVIEWPEKIPHWLAARPHRLLTISIEGEGRKVAES